MLADGSAGYTYGLRAPAAHAVELRANAGFGLSRSAGVGFGFAGHVGPEWVKGALTGHAYLMQEMGRGVTLFARGGGTGFQLETMKLDGQWRVSAGAFSPFGDLGVLLGDSCGLVTYVSAGGENRFASVPDQGFISILAGWGCAARK